MAAEKFVAYFRVSTERQGRSGLGLQAQRDAVMAHLGNVSSRLLAEFTEVESGKHDQRPELQRALMRAKVSGAAHHRQDGSAVTPRRVPAPTSGQWREICRG